jgi:hypothetical protein
LYDFARNYNWPPEANGIALFRSEGVFRRHPVAFAAPEVVFVGERFHLDPLINEGDDDPHFYVLTLNRTGAKLLEAAHGRMAVVDGVTFPGYPTRAEATTWQSRFDRSWRQAFGILRQRRGNDEKRTQQLRLWLRQVDQLLIARVGQRRSPVVLAAVQHLCCMYRHVSRYPHFPEAEIHGNAEHMSADLLWELANHLAAPHLRTSLKRDMDEYLRLWHTARASNELPVIASAARQGRIAVLFVIERCWHAIKNPTRASGCGPELIEMAVLDTFVNGGRVHCVPSEQMPDGASTAAVFRY